MNLLKSFFSCVKDFCGAFSVAVIIVGMAVGALLIVELSYSKYAIVLISVIAVVAVLSGAYFPSARDNEHQLTMNELARRQGQVIPYPHARKKT